MNGPNNQTPFLQTGNPNTENRLPDSYSKGQLGYRFVFNDPTDGNKGKRYQLVERDSHDTGTLTAGQLVYWNAAYGYGVTESDTVSGRGGVAGVVQTNITPGYVGCIQIGGPSLVTYATGTPLATGLFAIPSATDGQFEAVAAGTAAAYPPIGLTRSAGASSQATVELQLPGRN